MRQLFALGLSTLCISAYAAGPAIKINVTTPGHIASYQLVSGDNVKVYPTDIIPVHGYVYDQNRWFYNTIGAPIQLSGSFSMPADAKFFPFQIIIGSCGQSEPSTALWSKFHTNSTLDISANNAALTACQAGGKYAGSGLVSITPISDYKYPAGTYTLQLHTA
ncbi:MAG: hypothetical protein P1U40_03955 [Coxiellaceae bacterium]|nr:hypothetical protein [Coxiellaceae bacterium]